jgi:hypothetical protein
MTRLYAAIAAWATRKAGITQPAPDAHTCTECGQPVGKDGWHVAARRHDKCGLLPPSLARYVGGEQ